jgi:hypothetical protein
VYSQIVEVNGTSVDAYNGQRGMNVIYDDDSCYGHCRNHIIDHNNAIIVIGIVMCWGCWQTIRNTIGGPNSIECYFTSHTHTNTHT